MMQAEQIASFQDCFGRTSVGVANERCLNARYKGAGCTRCADACPTAAIVLEAGTPQMDDDQCVRCGVCLHACPTDVFSQRKAPEATLRQTVAQLPVQPISLVCPLHPQPAKSNLPVAAVVRHGRCLAALSAEDLLFLSQRGDRPLWLDDGICDRCPIGRAQTVLQRSVDVANRLLSAFGRPASIHLHSLEAETVPVEPVSRPVLDGMQPRFSRRGIFSTLGRAAQERVKEATEEEIDLAPVRSALSSDRLPQGLPRSRRRLLSCLSGMAPRSRSDRNTALETEGTPFAAVYIDAERCSACGLCARFCPTGALAFIGDGERYQLNFQAAACIDCDICTEACPEDAIALGDFVATEDLVSLASQPLASDELVTCRECGAPTAVSHDGTEAPLCYACRQGAGTVRPLQDKAGLMADLLARLPSGAA